jgi:fructose-1,6-bisphosphatase-3
VCDRILDEFHVKGQYRHIINGHVPVKTIKGEKPIKASGKLMVIDGGFSKAYQPETGIAGYTLVFHSRGFQLVQHEPFTSITKAVEDGQDIKSTVQLVEMTNRRIMVKDTDIGNELQEQIRDLEELLQAYHTGMIIEREWRPITNKR